MPLWNADRPVSELAVRWAKPPSTFVSVEGMQVHVRDEGPRDAPTLVLVHWQFAVAEPGRVAALVLLASAGYPRMTPRTFGFRLAMSPLGPLILRLASKTAVKRSIRRTYGDPSKVTQEVIDRSYDLMQAPGVRNALGATLRQLDASEKSALIRTITVPTLILWGTNDAVVPYADAERFHADIVGSTLVTLPGVGHLPQEEDPDATAASFRRFWDGIDQSASASKVTS